MRRAALICWGAFLVFTFVLPGVSILMSKIGEFSTLPQNLPQGRVLAEVGSTVAVFIYLCMYLAIAILGVIMTRKIFPKTSNALASSASVPPVRHTGLKVLFIGGLLLALSMRIPATILSVFVGGNSDLLFAVLSSVTFPLGLLLTFGSGVILLTRKD